MFLITMGQCANDPSAFGEIGPPESVIFGKSETMAAVRRNLVKVADTNIPILIEGESGTGKEVICGYIHRQSIWKSGPFVKVSCPAVPESLLESEFLSNGRAAFSEAFSAFSGSGMGGTLFLDEVSELTPSLQSKLLQALQNGKFQRIDSTTGKKINVRVICATNRRLLHEVGAERFRQDLYYRITGLVLRLPPLRERLEDLEPLSEYFVALYNDRLQCSVPPVSESTLQQMATHPWAGNIRELENLIRRYVVVGSEKAILSEITRREVLSNCREVIQAPRVSLVQLTRHAKLAMESRIILDALRANQWNRKRTANALNISYRSLLYKLKRAGIQNHRQVESAGAGGRTLENLS